MPWSNWASIYKTRLAKVGFQGRRKLTSRLSLEVIGGGEKRFITYYPKFTHVVASDTHIAQEGQDLLLNDESCNYLIFSFRTHEENPLLAQKEFETEVFTQIAHLALLTNPDLPSEPVYHGPVSRFSSDVKTLESWFKATYEADLSLSVLEVITDSGGMPCLDKTHQDKFLLMCKYFVKAKSLPPSEEKFLWLWTVLEIFPMEDASDVAPAESFLAQKCGLPLSEITKRLSLGRMHGLRSNYLHSGVLSANKKTLAPLPLTEVIDVCDRLDRVICFVMSYMAGVAQSALPLQTFPRIPSIDN